MTSPIGPTPASARPRSVSVLIIALVGVALAGAPDAYAARLEVAPDAPILARFGAAALLILHVGGGAVGLVAGALALISRKGAIVHRRAGRVFLISMFVAYLIGAAVAPFLAVGQRPNFVAGILALYLLVTGVMAAQRRNFRAGPAERAGLVMALLITGMGLWFWYQGLQSPSGTVDGSPPQAFAVFIVAGTAAAVGEVNALVRRTLAERARKVRHLWRMCASLFIASGSLFLGQPQVFPGWFNESILPTTLALAPVAVMLVWVVLLRWPKRQQQPERLRQRT